MDRTDLVRLRWRLTGAWFGPCFLVLSFVDAAVIHWLPPAGDSVSTVGAWLLGTALMLFAVVVASPLLGAVLRKGRRDLPKNIARNYAGTFIALGVSLAFLVAGVVHHHVVDSDHSAVIDAQERAAAWIGDHAPTVYQEELGREDVIEIQPPEIYRVCVPDPQGDRFYCVVVNRSKPFATSVTFDGTESNQLLDEGAN